MTAQLERMRALLREVWAEALAKVAPAPRVRAALAELGERDGEWARRPRYVMAVGKAAHSMLEGAAEGGWVEAIVVGPAGAGEGRGAEPGSGSDSASASGTASASALPSASVWRAEPAGAAPPAAASASSGPVRFLVGAHPVPDASSVAAAEELRRFVARVPPEGLLVALISGGGSAMVAAPRPGLSLEEKIAATSKKMAEGASIAELNQLRRALSSVKGGQLVAACAAPVLTLIVSDVAGDDPRVVASGLTLHDGRPQDRCRVIAGQDAVARAAAAALAARGWPVVLRQEPLVGEVGGAAAELLALRAGNPGAADRVAVIAHGEPVVALPPDAGTGGRAQQLALLLARALDGQPVAALVAGSDGADGPSLPPVAGGLVDGATWRALGAAGIDGARALARCDARPALAAVDRLLVTGPTGRNHADAMIVLWDPPAA